MKKANTHVRSTPIFTKVIMRVAAAFSIAYQVALVQGSMAPENASKPVGIVTEVEQEGNKWKVEVVYQTGINHAKFTFISSRSRAIGDELNLPGITSFFDNAESKFKPDEDGDLILDCGTSADGVSALLGLTALDHEFEGTNDYDSSEGDDEVCANFREWTSGLDALNP